MQRDVQARLALTIGFTELVDKLNVNFMRNDAALVPFTQQAAHRFAAAVGVIER